MKYVVLHKSDKRIRIKIPIINMSYRQADLLEYYLKSIPWIKDAVVDERTCNAILSAKLIRYQCLSLPLLALYAISSMFLQNIGKYFSALFISVARQGLFYVPLLFGLNLMLGEFGIYIVQPVADILSVIFAVLVVIFSWNKIFED